jgi:sec-independent protein translocase protein TatB
MFGIGTGEILVILLIALLVLGPKELPKVARTIGKTMRELQRTKDDILQSVDTEFDDYREDSKPMEHKAEENVEENKDVKKQDNPI